MTTEEAPTEQAIRAWIIGAVAQIARVDAASLGPETAFEDLGVSSLAALTLATELSDRFGVDVDPLVAWDYPTIGEVARAIFSRLAAVPPVG